SLASVYAYCSCSDGQKIPPAVIRWQTGPRLGAVVCCFPVKYAANYLADLHIPQRTANMADLSADPRCSGCGGPPFARSSGAKLRQPGKIGGCCATRPSSR